MTNILNISSTDKELVESIFSNCKSIMRTHFNSIPEDDCEFEGFNIQFDHSIK